METTTQTKAATLKQQIIAFVKQAIEDQQNDIETGIDEGIYEDDEDNKKTLKRLTDMEKLVKEFENYSPQIFVYVDGGNIQGVSGTEPIGVDIFDKDNYDVGGDEFIENYGTPDEWEEMIKEKTDNGEIMGIY